MRKVVIANDHGALNIVPKIIKHLESRGFVVEYLGVAEEVSVDYPDKALQACLKYLEGGYEFGILACGTGIGISITANKVKGIRCSTPQNIFASQMSKEHNNCNFISFGGRINYQDDILDMIDAYIDANFAGGRHETRVNKIMKVEENYL